MILALPLVVGVVVGRLVGGSFKNLAATPIRFGWLFVLGLGFQLALFTRLTDEQSWDIRYGHDLYVVSLVLVLSALVLNLGRLQWPLLIMAVGAGLNLVVIVVNGGAMPVDLHLLALAQGHQLVASLAHHRVATNVAPLTAATRLAWLGDRIPIAASVYSVGDVTLGAGAFLLTLFEMNRGRWPHLVGLAQLRKPIPFTNAA